MVDRETIVRCKTFGHAWDEFHPINMRGPSFGWRISIRCTRGCGTERHDLINDLGMLLQREYRYDPDYKLFESMSMQEKRIELRRITRSRKRKSS